MTAELCSVVSGPPFLFQNNHNSSFEKCDGCCHEVLRKVVKANGHHRLRLAMKFLKHLHYACVLIKRSLHRSGYISIDEYVQFMVMSARKSSIASKSELVNAFKSITATGDRDFILPRELREHLSPQVGFKGASLSSSRFLGNISLLK